ncbi:MAG: hypothetical protein JNM84_09590, partial [Planctomycetes bacterium]|nr:hypothetical protein [Planctomycetota bacterium]
REREALRGFFAPREHALFRPTSGDLASARQRAQDVANTLGGEPAELRVVRAPDGASAFELEREPRALAPLARELRSQGFESLELGDARPHYLLGHAPGFREQPELLRLLNESYVLSAALAEPRGAEVLDELWVLARADLASGGWSFARRHERARHAALRDELSQPVDLLFVDAEGRPVIELVGVEIEPRWARDGFALSRWIWRASRELAVGELARTARRATAGPGARQVDGPIGGGLFEAASWPALELREDLVLLPLRGLAAERASGAFALWVALFDARGVALSPLDRSRFPRSADGFARVGGGVAERFSDRSFPRRDDAARR